MDSNSGSRAYEKMKPTGIHWTAHAQLIRLGGLIGTKKIKPDEVGGFIQALRASDVEPKEEKIETARDRTNGGQDPHFPVFLPSDAFLDTGERDVPPLVVDFPIQVDSPSYRVEMGTRPNTAHVNPSIGNAPSDIPDVDLTTMGDPLRKLVYATDDWVIAAPLRALARMRRFVRLGTHIRRILTFYSPRFSFPHQ